MIDEFKAKLEERKQQKENQKPDLQPLIDVIHSGELKLLLQKSSLIEEENKLLEGSKTFSSEEVEKFTQLNQDKACLEKNNIEDSKKVLRQEKKEINDLRDHLSNLKINLETLTRNILFSVNDYLEKKKIRSERVKQFEVLKNIPSQNTEEWQGFIESAEDYGTKIEQDVFNKDKRCVYCHQPLDDEAIKLVKAYSRYLSDESQQNFKNVADKISKLEIEIDRFITEFSFSENLRKSLADISNEQNQTYKALIDQVLERAKKQKIIFTRILKNKILTSDECTLDLLKIDEKLVKISKEKQKAIDNLQQSDIQKAEKIDKLEEKIHLLEDKKNILRWKSKIETYYSCCEAVQKYTILNQSIRTKVITDLGSKAHNELLTNSIRQFFEDELKALGKDIEVTLESERAGKGKVFTKLKMLGNDVNDILSDGEQKAVGLALFLAENKSQNNGCPIVFDDPVTSVDHEVAHILAKRLLQVSLNRQIIIFTHNKLFYDSLIYWGSNLKDEKNNKTHHICKNYTQNGCNGKGCHIYTYKVDREAKDRLGRVFEAQNESCSYFIEKAEHEMKSDYSLSCVVLCLKLAIENYIDEKILNKQGLLKDKKIKDHIEWEMLKGLNPDKNTIDKLKICWDNLNSRGAHLSKNSLENPLSGEDLNNIITFLKS